MILKTKLDWQGYNLLLQNEQTMGASLQATAMGESISTFCAKVNETQEVLRDMTRILQNLYPGVHSGILARADAVLADYAPSGIDRIALGFDMPGSAENGESKAQKSGVSGG